MVALLREGGVLLKCLLLTFLLCVQREKKRAARVPEHMANRRVVLQSAVWSVASRSRNGAGQE